MQRDVDLGRNNSRVPYSFYVGAPQELVGFFPGALAVVAGILISCGRVLEASGPVKGCPAELPSQSAHPEISHHYNRLVR